MIKQFFAPLNWIQNAQFFWVVYAVFSVVWMIYPVGIYFLGWHGIIDIGLQTQPIVNLAVNQTYWNTFFDCHPFANHFRPGLLIFYPFIVAFPSIPPTLWPVMAKSIAFVACPLILLRFGRAVLTDHRWVFALPLFWMFSDLLMHPMTTPNYATTLIIPVTLIAFYWGYQGHYIRLYPIVMGLSLFKENMPLIGVCLGIFLMIEKREWRHGLGLFFSSIALGCLIFFVIMPAFGSGSGPNVFPIRPWGNLDWKLTMLIKVHLGIGFLAFLKPHTILYHLPSLAVYLLVDTGRSWKMYYFTNGHYHDYTMTILFVSALFAINYFSNGQSWFCRVAANRQRLLGSVLVVAVMIVGLTNLPRMLEVSEMMPAKRYAQYQSVKAIAAKIPKTATVMVTDYSGYLFLDRPRIQKASWSLEANDADFIVLPKNAELAGEHAGEYANIQAHIDQKVQAGILTKHPYSTADVDVYSPVPNR